MRHRPTLSVANPAWTAPLALFLVLAMLLRALVPDGYMPDMQGSHPFQMVICSMDGAKSVTLDQKFNPFKKAPAHKTQAHDTPCAFAAHHVLAALPSAAPTLLIQHDTMHVPWVPQDRLAWQRFFGNASSRAPPVTLL